MADDIRDALDEIGVPSSRIDADLGVLGSAQELFELPEELPLLVNQTRALSAALQLTQWLRMDSLNEVVLHMFHRQMVAVFGRRLDLAKSGSLPPIDLRFGTTESRPHCHLNEPRRTYQQ